LTAPSSREITTPGIWFLAEVRSLRRGEDDEARLDQAMRIADHQVESSIAAPVSIA